MDKEVPVRKVAAPLASLIALSISPTTAHSNNGAMVVAQSDVQFNHRLVSDGSGGAFVVWDDYRNGQYDIYAQRLDASGGPAWGLGGISVCAAAGEQSNAQIVRDGAGGIIVCWQDARSGTYDIYVQRLDASGAPLWGFSGRPVSTASSEQALPQISADGTGGAIIAWRDARFGTYDIFAQKFSSAGIAQWTVDGVAVSTSGGDQAVPTLDTDGSGGAIIVWEDRRTGALDIYAQRLNPSGVPQWTFNGIPVCAIPGDQLSARIVADGASGAFLTWEDDRIGTRRVYAQHLNGLGVSLWTTDGAAVATPPAYTYQPQLVPDASGGIIVCWYDARAGDYDVYAQLMSSSGIPQWTANGVPICSAIGSQTRPTLAADGAGGAIVSWEDSRFGPFDIYSQRVSNTGARLWDLDGVSISSATSTQELPRIVPDGSGGAVIVWRDLRFSATTYYDLFAQRINAAGVPQFPDAEYPSMVSVRDVPNDQGGRVRLSWLANIQDLAPFNQVAEYWVWRSVPTLGLATHAQRIDLSRANPSKNIARSDILVTTIDGDDYFWEFLDSQPAGHLYRYSYVAATTSDSIQGSNPYTAFMVQARTSNGSSWWYSNPDSGYSVDNLPPPAPQGFTGDYSQSSTSLSWLPTTASDLGTYRIHRGGSESFIPSPSNLIVETLNEEYVDPVSGNNFYKLFVVDTHGNVGPVALVRPPGALDVHEPNVTGVWLSSAMPNPVRTGSTSLAFGADAGTRVDLLLHDTSGRHVRTLYTGTSQGGRTTVQWNGTNEKGALVPDGVYWVTLRTPSVVRTARLIVIR